MHASLHEALEPGGLLMMSNQCGEPQAMSGEVTLSITLEYHEKFSLD
jgi:hypothetical protein